MLPFPVDGALDDLDDQPEATLRLVPGSLDIQRQQRFALAGAGFDKGLCFLGALDPVRLVLLA